MEPKTSPLIRPEENKDRAAVYALNTAAFGSVAEADLVDRLREQARPIVSLVAEARDGVVVGHIFFSPVSLSMAPTGTILGLGPMAVVPPRQRQGIGTALVEEGLQQCRNIGAGAVVVLGHPEYYPRFGFVTASTYGIESEFDSAPEAFMALELVPGFLEGLRGTIRYHKAFHEL